MKLKNIMLFVCLFILSIVLSSCSSDYNEIDNGDKGGSGDVIEEIETEDETVPNRKIIYEVNADITADNLLESISMVKDQLNEDEWLDSENISNNHATLIIRVKSERLDEFLNSIKQNHEISYFSKTATDISLKYQDKSQLLLTYLAERERLLELYENASLQDMLTINKRLSEIDIQIAKLQGELNQFDSLVDYSVVTLKFYTTENQREETLVFGERVMNALKDGFGALILFLEICVIVIVAILPWAIVIVPTIFIVLYFTKRHRKKKYKDVKDSSNNLDN